MQTFYLGTHMPNWLDSPVIKQHRIPLFISRRLLCKRKTFPRAVHTWSLDSGGFTELNMYGEWSVTPKQYAKEVRRFMKEVGNLHWASIQDWMCEPFVLQKTQRTIAQHQQLTVNNFIELMSIDDSIPWIPVLQGWNEDDYIRCIHLYLHSGVDIFKHPVVAIGSVCRRQHTDEAGKIFKRISELGLNLHGFGLKLTAMKKYKEYVHSSDSMAWSFAARRDNPLPGHTHKNCANCLDYALLWYKKVDKTIKEST